MAGMEILGEFHTVTLPDGKLGLAFTGPTVLGTSASGLGERRTVVLAEGLGGMEAAMSQLFLTALLRALEPTEEKP